MFEDGEVPIIDAFEGLFDRIITLSDESYLDDMQYATRQVESFTSSIRDTQHELLHLTMQSGGELKITQNHPMLTSDGIMVEAGDLKIGDSLLNQFGEADQIVSKEDFPYFGKVYNVAPHANSREGHILIAEGYLTGSSWYQNNGVENLNRSILRRNVPDEILATSAN